MTASTYRKKLIEVALSLEAINEVSSREKSIRHGHPSTLHLSWGRRPLAARRAVFFPHLVGDPASVARKFPGEAEWKRDLTRFPLAGAAIRPALARVPFQGGVQAAS